jgi:hypothetical protein
MRLVRGRRLWLDMIMLFKLKDRNSHFVNIDSYIVNNDIYTITGTRGVLFLFFL